MLAAFDFAVEEPEVEVSDEFDGKLVFIIFVGGIKTLPILDAFLVGFRTMSDDGLVGAFTYKTGVEETTFFPVALREDTCLALHKFKGKLEMDGCSVGDGSSVGILNDDDTDVKVPN